jgi:hypothetical protein
MRLLKFSRLAIIATLFSLSLTSSAFAVDIEDRLIIFSQGTDATKKLAMFDSCADKRLPEFWEETCKRNDLQRLIVSGISLHPEGGLTDDFLKCIGSNLQELVLISRDNFFGCRITDEGLAYISGLKHLQKLFLEGLSKVTDDGLKHIGSLHGLQSLELFDLPRATDDSLEPVRGLLNLQSLVLGRLPDITDRGLEHIISLPLERLVLNRLSNITSVAFSHISRLPNLQNLTLIHKDPLNGLIHVSHMDHLESLALEAHSITEDVLKEVSNNLRNLRKLTLRGSRFIPGISIKHLDNVRNLEQLTLEDLRETATIVDFEHINLDSLKSLTLIGLELTDRALAHVSRMVNLQNLTCERLPDITEYGLTHVSRMVNLKKFTLIGPYEWLKTPDDITRIRGMFITVPDIVVKPKRSRAEELRGLLMPFSGEEELSGLLRPFLDEEEGKEEEQRILI